MCRVHKIHQTLSLAFMAMGEVEEEEEVVVAAVEVGLSLLKDKEKGICQGIHSHSTSGDNYTLCKQTWMVSEHLL